MAELPKIFTDHTRQLMGDERFERYLQSFEEEPPVSIRLNPRKTEGMTVVEGEPVPWCCNGWYLKKRPVFTFDPLLHAGCYYVQEAASMFLDEVLRQQIVNSKLSNSKCLDLCAAPGGKSTLLRSALPEACVLYSNEPIRNRFNILSENVQKWGAENHIVTNQYPKDYRKSKMKFDIILCDVPCSGEGMFRKDEATIREWSPQNVEKCWQLQRSIVADIWPCLNDGGILIYSTCTFNTKENEENIRWLLEEYDAEVLSVDVKPEWNITGSLLEGFNEPVYRFIPGMSRGEGLFLCVLRKGLHHTVGHLQKYCGASTEVLWGIHNNTVGHPQQHCGASTTTLWGIHNNTVRHLQKDCRNPSKCVQCELSYTQAINFLRGEALVLPENTPRGEVEVCFEGHPLGKVKNIGSRANNQYPKEWRIKTTHIPNDYEAILRHT